MMMYQQQPMGMGYGQPSYYGGGGYPQSQMQGLPPPIDKAPVCCNCCNCTHYGCAKFWVIYNGIQVVLCYIILITEAILGIASMKDSNSTQISYQESLASSDLFACVEKTKEDSIKATKLSIVIVLLLIYTIGSILYSIAVFGKNMDIRKRALFLMVYTATIVSFPLAYLIPFLIDLSICTALAIAILIVFSAWYISVIVSTVLAFNIAIVYRKWIMMPNMAVMPESQQQIIAQQSSGSVHQKSGKDSDSDN